MATRKIVRDFFFSKNHLYFQFPTYQQLQQSNMKLRLITGNGYSSNRQFSVLNEFSKKIKGEASSNKEFQQSVKQLKDKAEELKGVKEDLKVRVKQTTEHLHKHVDGVWTEAEETAKKTKREPQSWRLGEPQELRDLRQTKGGGGASIGELSPSICRNFNRPRMSKVSANMKEKIAAAKDEVKETLGLGSQEASGSNNSTNDGDKVKDGTKPSSGEQYHKAEPNGTTNTFFSNIRSTFVSSSPKVSLAFQKLKEAKVADLAKKSYDIVKEELSGKPNRRKRMQYAASSSMGEKSDRTEVVVVPVKQSPWSKKWESLKEKMRGHPMFKNVTKMSEPVVTKSQESHLIEKFFPKLCQLAEDLQERWETSDSPVVHKIQDINDRVFGENDSAMSFKEIRRRDPLFSLPDFVAEVQEVIRPVLNAYLKGDIKVLAKYCSSEIVERCKAEHKAFESQNIFFDNKGGITFLALEILHVSEVDLRETKMMGSSPIIILAFQTQQVYCVRDRQGSIKDGSQVSFESFYCIGNSKEALNSIKLDTIHTIYYAWAMQQMDPEDLDDDAIYSMWRLKEMQQLGVAALI
ncbi:Mitochondrial import inner membrane translocase subunit TIM44-2 [Bienertia sinuspersici]